MSNMLMALAALTMVFPNFSSLRTTDTSFIMLRKFLWTLLFLLNISSKFIAFISLSRFSFRFRSFFVEFTVFAPEQFILCGEKGSFECFYPWHIIISSYDTALPFLKICIYIQDSTLIEKLDCWNPALCNAPSSISYENCSFYTPVHLLNYSRYCNGDHYMQF